MILGVAWVPREQVGGFLVALWGGVMVFGGAGLALANSAHDGKQRARARNCLQFAIFLLFPAVTLSLSALTQS